MSMVLSASGFDFRQCTGFVNAMDVPHERAVMGVPMQAPAIERQSSHPLQVEDLAATVKELDARSANAAAAATSAASLRQRIAALQVLSDMIMRSCRNTTNTI